MDNIFYIYKKLNNSRIVWLKRSNQYINLKEPAFDVFQMLAGETGKRIISEILREKYGFDISLCQNLIENIDTLISENISPDENNPEITGNSNVGSFEFIPFSTRQYQFNDKLFSVSFENKNIENWFHPIFSHHELPKTEEAHYHFELFSFNGKLVFRFWETDEKQNKGDLPIFEAKNLFAKLANLIYNKTENDWLMTVHASAITNKKKTILITASSGSGKTTLAALLLTKNLHLVSDDLVSVDKQLNAYNFPSAMSVKRGALNSLLDFYPELKDKKEFHFSDEKKVRYLTTASHTNENPGFYPVKEVVFVQYDPKTEFKLTRLKRFNGIKRFLENAYIPPDEECAGIFLDWALKTSFYSLTYSDKEKATSAMIKIFEND